MLYLKILHIPRILIKPTTDLKERNLFFSFCESDSRNAFSGSYFCSFWLGIWLSLLRFVVPIVLLWVLWNSVPATLRSVAGLF